MKKLISAILIYLLAFQGLALAAWDKSVPAGASNASDIDANVIANNTALESLLSGPYGFSNLKIVRDSATQVTVTADQLYLQSTSNLGVRQTSVSEAIAITTSGANGLDTGVEAISTWYYVWIIRKSADGTIDGLLSTSSSSPTLPSGYNQKALVSAVRNDSSGDFISFTQEGRVYAFSTPQTLSSGSLGVGSWTSVSTSGLVPSVLSTLAFGSYTDGGSSGMVAYTSAAALSGATYGVVRHSAGSTNSAQWQFSIATANTLYAASDNSGFVMYINGFLVNKLS